MHYQDYPLTGINRLHKGQLIKKKIVSKINYTKKLPEPIFTINLELKEKNQQKEPSLKAEYEMGTYLTFIFVRK